MKKMYEQPELNKMEMTSTQPIATISGDEDGVHWDEE